MPTRKFRPILRKDSGQKKSLGYRIEIQSFEK